MQGRNINLDSFQFTKQKMLFSVTPKRKIAGYATNLTVYVKIQYSKQTNFFLKGI